MNRAAWWCIVTGFLAGGCGGGATAPPEETPAPAAVKRVEVSPDRDRVTSFRYQRRFQATAYDADGNEVAGRVAAWTSSDPSVVAVDSGGLVTPVWEGRATVTASIDGVNGAAEVTVAPDLLAFMSDRTGNWDIFIVARDGTGARNLTEHPAFDQMPRWSPDGTRISFHSDRDGGGVYVMNADGSGLVRVSSAATGASRYHSWSPDGTRLVYASVEPDSVMELYVVGADGTGLTPITRCACTNDQPDWSPDGSRIAFHSIRDTLTYPEIFTVAPDGTDLVNLTNNQSSDRYPRWSPDGRTILFLSGRGGPFLLYTMSASGADPRQLTTIQPLSGLWSPDGLWVAFVGNSALHVIRPDGTGRVALTGGLLSYFSWSADSQELAFTFSTSGGTTGAANMNLAIVGLDGARETIVKDLGDDQWPQMRPRRP